MKIEQKFIKVEEIFDGYYDNEEGGVGGYGGKLDIRPPYQREFIYEIKRQVAVVDSVIHKYPLNVMYWAKRTHCKSGKLYEVLDGQQRTLSLLHFIEGRFSVTVDGTSYFFNTLPERLKNRILKYELVIYFCEGDDEDTLRWFQRINIQGEPLSQQELLNALHGCQWVQSAKGYFSKVNGAGAIMGKPFFPRSAKLKRQEYLREAIKWHCYAAPTKKKPTVSEYMAEHQSKDTIDATELWLYFKGVVDWVQKMFGYPRETAKAVNWGKMYAKYRDSKLDPIAVQQELNELMENEYVGSASGIYEYILAGSNEEYLLNLREFSYEDKIKRYEEQKGLCGVCEEHFEFDEMEGDHNHPWIKGGKTIKSNLKMLCKDCNRTKSDKVN